MAHLAMMARRVSVLVKKQLPIIGHVSVVALLLFDVDVCAADWPQYRGPSQNGVAAESLPPTISKAEPRELWKAALGIGTSGIAVANGRAYSMGNERDKDVVRCLEARTGREVWKHSYPLALDKRMFEGGPAATPTVDGNFVYTVSHQGDLWCLDAATGRKIWYKHYQKDFGGNRPQWGFAGSPLVEGNLLICDVGARRGSTIALDKTNGTLVWKSGNDGAGYATPVAATIAGRRTIVMFKANALVGLDAKDGRELWRSPWKTSYDVNAATPLVIRDTIFISSGYNSGCALVALEGGKAREVWRNKNLKAHINSPVAVNDHVYGVDDQVGGGRLVCLDLANGKLAWHERGVSGGALIAADAKLIVVSEKGELVIAEANPVDFKPLARAQVLGGRCWVQPTLANGLLYVKNNAGDLVCLELK
jgi:outer membrane protein assembly factor BamB